MTVADKWVCTKCGEPSWGNPDILLLDNSYGSMRCHSTVCKNQKRVFHLEPRPSPPVKET